MASLLYMLDGRSAEITLGESTTIGRAPTNVVRVSDPSVSRTHAIVKRLATGRYLLEDNGSAHGTFVAGTRVTSVLLAHGDGIRLGDSELHFLDPQAVGGSTPQVAVAMGEASGRDLEQRVPIQAAPRVPAFESVGADPSLAYERLRAIHVLTLAIGAEPDPARAMARVLKTAVELLAAERGAILLAPPGGGPLQPALTRNPGGVNEPIVISRSIVRDVTTQRAGVITADAGLDARYSATDTVREQGIRSALCVPMVHGGELFGALYLDSRARPNAFVAADLELASALAAHAAMVLKTARLSEAAQQAAEQRRLAAIVERLPEGVVLLDATHTIVATNAPARAHLAALGAPASGRLEAIAAVALDSLADGTLKDVHVAGPPRRAFRLQTVPAGEAGSPGATLLLVRDVTDERARARAEERRRRLSGLSRLAGSVAHAFNDAVTVVTGFADLAAQRLAAGDSAQDEVEQVRGAAERMAALTRDLLALGLADVAQVRILDAAGLVHTWAAELRSGLPPGVTLDVQADPGPPFVRMDAEQLRQVVTRLVARAAAAIPPGGRITLRREVGAATPPDDVAEDAAPGATWVRFAVHDNGPQASAEDIARALNPFATAGATGIDGLALATCLAICTRAGGTLEIVPASGGGTTVRVWLPASTGAPAPALPVPSAGAPASFGADILLVEDVAGVRDLAVRVLRQAGYRVTAARDAEGAAAALASGGGGLDLLVTDLVLPGRSGAELATELRRGRPSLPIVLMTGHPSEAARAAVPTGPGVVLLEKPFRPDQLLATVRALLESAGARPGTPARDAPK